MEAQYRKTRALGKYRDEIDDDFRMLLLAMQYFRNKFLCAYCTRQLTFSQDMGFPKPNYKYKQKEHRTANLDHIIPVTSGGDDIDPKTGLYAIYNMVYLCAWCNQEIKSGYSTFHARWQAYRMNTNSDAIGAGTIDFADFWDECKLMLRKWQHDKEVGKLNLHFGRLIPYWYHEIKFPYRPYFPGLNEDNGSVDTAQSFLLEFAIRTEALLQFLSKTPSMAAIKTVRKTYRVYFGTTPEIYLQKTSWMLKMSGY